MTAVNADKPIGLVVIGRNEARHLSRALSPELVRRTAAIYVDSGSTDRSAETAESLGATVHELDPAHPFSPARARYEGAAVLMKKHPEIEFIQFLDGDCELHENWIERAKVALSAEHDIAIVCGRLEERYPDASVYNRLSAMQWNNVTGDIAACGGIFLARRGCYEKSGGFDSRLITGEEADLCSRIRQDGGRIVRLDVPMAVHDSELLHFRQWWSRAVWGGYGGALKVMARRDSSMVERLRQLHQRLTWPILVPMVGLISMLCMVWSIWFGAIPLLIIAAYVLLFVRIAVDQLQHQDSIRDASVYAAFCILRKFAVAAGFLQFFLTRKSNDKRPDPHGSPASPVGAGQSSSS